MSKSLELSGQPLELAKHYRTRAEQLRIIASEWADTGIREILVRVAQSYEHMADRSEKQAQLAAQKRSPAEAARIGNPY